MSGPSISAFKNITLILFILGISVFAFAQDINTKQGMARDYRNQGWELQRRGDLDGAMSLYQKAIEIDPFYAVAYNDLGIIYESNAWLDRAEQSYLQAIKVDPNYPSAYSNLALLYENKRDLKKAAFYWEKRAELGSPDDPWTEKAKKRLEDIHLALGEKTLTSIREQEVVDLIKDMAIKKSISKLDNKTLANMHFEKAKLSDKRGDELAAYKEATQALQFDPSNQEIEKFVGKLQTRLLTR